MDSTTALVHEWIFLEPFAVEFSPFLYEVILGKTKN